MRELWLQQHMFQGDDINFINFDQELRSMRVSAPHINVDWHLDPANNHEQQLLNKYMLAVTSARVDAAISSRPPKSVGSPGEEATKRGRRANGKGGKSNKTASPATQHLCTDYASGSCSNRNCQLRHADDYNAIPKHINDEIGKLKPAVCRAFAYHGRCAKSNGDACQSSRGNTLLHTCYKCLFANGRHPISNGSCPN